MLFQDFKDNIFDFTILKTGRAPLKFVMPQDLLNRSTFPALKKAVNGQKAKTVLHVLNA